MNKKVYTVNKGISHNMYERFIHYAFQTCGAFMLVFINYNNKGYQKSHRELKQRLEPYIIKSRSNPSWPGTPFTHSVNTTYSIVFYRTQAETENILKSLDVVLDNSFSFVCDLAFFRDDECWFYSVTHESMAYFIGANSDDMIALSEFDLIDVKNPLVYYESFYKQFNEPGLGKLLSNSK